MNKQNQIIASIVVLLVVAGGSFYAGMKYDAGKSVSQVAARGGQGGFGGTAGRGAGAGQGAAGRGASANGAAAGGFSGGQITAKDDTSITIANRGGGSQIVFFSPSTTVGKSVTGATTDLSIGEQVTVTGKANSDGSIAAQDIQIRPAAPAGAPAAAGQAQGQSQSQPQQNQ